MGTDLPQDLWAELQHDLECFELGFVLTKQPLALQHFCPCLCCLLTLKRWAEGENNPAGKLMGKGRATMDGGVSPALLREDEGCGLLRWICHRRAVPELCSWDGSFTLHPQNKEQVINIVPGLGMRGHQEAEQLVLWNTSNEWSLSQEPRSCASPTITRL